MIGVGALLGDGERSGIEIDVLPAQAGELASPQSGVQGEDPQRREAVVGDGGEERRRLLYSPHPHLLALASWHPRSGRRVGWDEVPAHGVGECAMQVRWASCTEATASAPPSTRP